MALTSGTRLGQYEVLSLIGKGGMGEVYRAHESKLGRDVAIKVLPEIFARDPDRLARFKREARLLASLNHSHIATIHGLEEAGSSHFLVMELVSGETLHDLLSRDGPFPIEKALGITRQIAEALEAAHDKGIIHRDLKPANVKVTPEGKVKVLDFGLAKAFEPSSSTPDEGLLSNSPTNSASPTMHGVILGTAAYMSPEQAKGKPLDKRTDIWSLGCVLFELLAGKPAFTGDSVTEILGGVLKVDPDWSALPEATPHAVRALLRRCLEKDASRRLRGAGDIAIALEDAISAPAVSHAAIAASTPSRVFWRKGTLPWVAALSLGLIIAVAAWQLKPALVPVSRPVERLTITLPPNTSLVRSTLDSVALSPDGSRLAYLAARSGEPQRLFLRVMDNLESTALPGTEGAFSPFFSPDGQWIGFFAGGNLKKISISGGAAFSLCNAPAGRGAAWGPNETIVFTGSNGGSGLNQVSAAGGDPQLFTTLQKGELSHRWPQFLPDGKTVLFTIGVTNNFDDALIAAQRLDSKEYKILIRGGTYARYVPTGHLVYYRAGTMMAVPFDPERLELKGVPVPIVGAVMADNAGGAAQFAFSNRGSLVYVPGGPQSSNLSLVWVDRHGVSQPLPAPERTYRAPRLSPDGSQAVVSIGPDVWNYNIGRDTLTRLTFEGVNTGTAAIWTPDGKRVAFPSNRAGGAANIYWKPADGSGAEERLTTSPNTQQVGSFSPDGQTLVYTEIDPRTGRDIWVMSLTGDRKPRVFLQTPFSESSALLSPDGHWVAYVSDESGRQEVYVRPFPGPGGKWQVSIEGGAEVAWSPKGNELFYRTGSQREKMMVAEIQTQPTFSSGKPHVLFEAPLISNAAAGAGAGALYAVSPDAQHFLMMKTPDLSQTALTQINVVLNWFSELQQRVPVK